jgi:hypothetical protein
MRRALAILLLLIARRASSFELDSDLSIGPGFVHQTLDAEGELADGLVGLGGGATMVGAFHDLRFGGQAKISISRSWLSGTLSGSWGPPQRGRGWATLEPQGAVHVERGRVVLDGELAVLLRRADAALRRRPLSIDQMQLRAEVTALIDEQWEVAISGLRSFYNPDPALRRLRGADLGLFISIGAQPELWAAMARVGRKLAAHLTVSLGLGWMDYAKGRGSAILPRATIRAGPWRGFSVEASGEVHVPLQTRERTGGLFGLKLAYER